MFYSEVSTRPDVTYTPGIPAKKPIKQYLQVADEEPNIEI
jgi:hypothetical protein